LVPPASVFHAFPEITNIDVLASDQLSCSVIEIVFEVADILMNSIGEFSIAFFDPSIVLPFIDLIFIIIKAISTKL
jgi:hypothetical protein